MRRAAVIVAAIVSLGGCAAHAPEPERAETVTFLENRSAFAGFVGGAFSMNLLFRTPPGTVPPEITDARFLPEAPWLEVTDVSVNENLPDGESRRWALGITARGSGPGQQEFGEMELTTEEGPIRVPIGRVRVEIVAGASAGLFALFVSGGVHPEPVPFEFTVENTTDSVATLRGVLLNHPLVGFAQNDIFVDGSPLGDAGYRLEPGAKVNVTVRWTVEEPDRPVNLEARPILVVERDGEVRYTGLHNMVVRKDEAINS